MRSTGTYVAATLALAALGHATVVQADTGARVLVQGFDPTRPDVELVQEVYRDPRIVSGQLQQAWLQAQPMLCAQIVHRMAEPRAVNGQTLRDISCNLANEVVLRVTSGGPGVFGAELETGGSFTATSTQPTPCGKACDPEVTLDVRGTLALKIAVQQDRHRLLRVTNAEYRLHDARLRPENWAAELGAFIAEDLIPFFGGPNYKRMVENAINAQHGTVTDHFDSALKPLNATLARYVPSDYLRVVASGANDMIGLAFIPRGINPPGNGVMRGEIRWNPAEFTPAGGCQSFAIGARVQTGPAPMWTNEGPPMLETGAFVARAAGEDRCTFTVTGLAADWPNFLNARLLDAGAARGGSLVSMNFTLGGDNWAGRVVVPKPSADGNFIVKRSLGGTAIEDAADILRRGPARTRANPVINPAQGVEQRTGTPAIGESRALNPQPLPPLPDPDGVPRTGLRSAAGAMGSTAVGGRAVPVTPVREKQVDKSDGPGP